MTRPLFDPSLIAGPPRPDRPRGDDAPLTVSAAAALLVGVIERNLPARIRVVGEISNLNVRTHWYFRLKDEQAVLDCVMFSSALRRVSMAPADGEKVLLTGRIEFYPKQGRVQFYAEAMEPVGAGELEQRFRALCAELKSLGWFDESRKRALPTLARRIAVVTSKTGAALQDFLVTAKKRFPVIDILTVDVRVQGEGAAAEIARILRWLTADHTRLGIYAILVTRGGGSIEDLWAFNERSVAEAIVECPIPVVAAIGHEVDTTIAELVADVRAATPTQAAMLLTPDRTALSEEVEQSFRRLRMLMVRSLEARRIHLRALSTRPAIADRRAILERPGRRLQELQRHIVHAAAARLARERLLIEKLGVRLARTEAGVRLAARRAAALELTSRLRRAAFHALERAGQRLDALERELIVVGPASVLARGYSVTTDSNGRVIRSTRDAAPGATVATRVSDGSFQSIVAGGSSASPELKPSVLPRRAKRNRPDAPDQMKLF